MIINRHIFFDEIRPIFGGLNSKQVEGMEAIITEFEKRGLTDKRWLAAMLGTARIEAGAGMVPIQENLNYSSSGLLKTWPSRVTPEKAAQLAFHPVLIANYFYGGRNGNVADDDGWKFRGRGYAQTTGRGNYMKIQWAAQSAGHDWNLVDNPDLLLTIPAAVFALIEGMVAGIYTGKKLVDYFNGSSEEWIKSRSIINGSFKAAEYVVYCKQFLNAIHE